MAPKRKRGPCSTSDADSAVSTLLSSITCTGTPAVFISRHDHVRDWMAENNHHAALIDDASSLRIPIPDECTQHYLRFFGDLAQPAMDRSTLADANELAANMREPLAEATLESYRSAILHLYHRENLLMDERLSEALLDIVEGYGRTMTALRQKGLVHSSHAKKKLLFEGYRYLSKQLMQKVPVRRWGSWATTSFSWSFMVLAWNLMSRADSLDTLMLAQFDWTNDCMTVKEQDHTADPKGKEKIPKSVFANPLEPHICPLLSLAVYVFAFNNGLKLYSGDNSQERFGDLLRQLVRELPEEEQQKLGCAPEDVSPYSLRKGSSAYCLSQVYGPSAVTVNLRMGQAVGKHWAAEAGGDQLCGRTVAGLPSSGENFGILPPHFHTDCDAFLTDDFWATICPNYVVMPDSFRRVLPYLLASLLYHEQFLRSHLCKSHSIFSAAVFSSNFWLPQLRAQILVGVGSCPVTGMKASGLPPHLAIAGKVAAMETKLEQLQAVLEKLTEILPKVISDHLRDHSREHSATEGPAAVPRHVFDSFRDEMRQGIENLNGQILQSAETNTNTTATAATTNTTTTNTTTTNITTTNTTTNITTTNTTTTATAATAIAAPVSSEESSNPGWWKVFDWQDGTLDHYVPKGWLFPARLPLVQLCALWFFGHQGEGIRPYRHLKGSAEFKQSTMCQKNLSRARKCMSELEKVIESEGLLPAGTQHIWQLSATAGSTLFQQGCEKILEGVYEGKEHPRKAELCYGTIANRLNGMEEFTKTGKLKVPRKK